MQFCTIWILTGDVWRCQGRRLKTAAYSTRAPAGRRPTKNPRAINLCTRYLTLLLLGFPHSCCWRCGKIESGSRCQDNQACHHWRNQEQRMPSPTGFMSDSSTRSCRCMHILGQPRQLLGTTAWWSHQEAEALSSHTCAVPCHGLACGGGRHGMYVLWVSTMCLCMFSTGLYSFSWNVHRYFVIIVTCKLWTVCESKIAISRTLRYCGGPS